MNRNLLKVIIGFCCLVLILAAGITNVNAQIASCGTTGTIGVNQICNGDFERGDSCFTTQYLRHDIQPDVSCGSCYRNWSNPNEYEVVTNVVTQFHTGFTSTPTDHTPTGTNHFMAIDGACNVGQKVWQQTVNIIPSTNYYFTMWFTSLHSSNPALLQFDINGTNVGLQQQLGAADGIWYQYTFTWNSGAFSGPGTISIENMTVAGCNNGNDFAIDDISFVSGCAFGAAGPQPDLGPDQNLCLGAVTLNANVPMTPTTIVRWSTGAGGVAGAGPYTIPISTAGTYSVCVQDNGSCIKSDIINVTASFSVDLGPDVVLCNPTNATLDAKLTSAGITYKWYKNGVAISGATARTLNVTSPATYSVDVTIPGCGTKSDAIIVSTQAPTPRDTTFCPPAVPVVKVTGTGTYNWYADAVTNTVLGTGNSYSPATAPGSTTTYWVKDISTFSYQVGPTTMVPGAGNDSYSTTQSNVFNALQTFNLDAVTVYGDLYTVSGPFTIGVTLRDNTGAMVWQQLVNLLSPNPLLPNPTKIVVPVNKSIPAGSNYTLTAEGTAGIGLKWNQTSTAMAYPYAIPGVINIYTINPAYSWLGANKGWGYFYNWELSAGVDCGRVPVTATVACSLPVELLTFEAFSTSGKVLLTWETASEKNTSHFIVQRSSDGINFESIGTVKANGNSNSPLLYSYIDYSPMHGTSYYRLLPYDSDGTFGTGPVKSITNNHTGIIINPNPNSGSFNISFTTDAGTRVKLTLINPLGQTVQEETLQSSSGEISRDMNIQSLASGIYFLHIEGADQKSISKIVKE